MRFAAKLLVRSRAYVIPSLLLIGVAAAQQTTSLPATPPLRLALQDALARARRNSVAYHSALTDAGVAREDKYQARAALLPSVTYNTSGIYTEGTGVDGGFKFIANNSVHEYSSQGNVHEAIDVAGFAEFRRNGAAAAAARARSEIASRGLVVTVVQTYYGVAAAQLKLEVAQLSKIDTGARTRRRGCPLRRYQSRTAGE
jgi:outer membrane protein